MDGLRYALAFLTRLPAGTHPGDAARLASGVPWFPVVGALVGGLVAVVYVPLAVVLPPLTAAAVAIGWSALVTGALHEDGFADSLDALGGRDAAHRLEILKDSRHGSFGVLGLVLLTLVKVTALAALTGGVAVAALVAAGALGRGVAAGLLDWAPAAAGQGMGASFVRAVSRPQVLSALGAAAVIGVLALGPLVLPAVGLVAAGAVVVAHWAQRRIGGVTGDVLGAAEQVAECAVLVLVAGVAPTHVWFV